ncbi:MAG: tetratricopeptide repeat protein [Pseudomonadota bacterium]
MQKIAAVFSAIAAAAASAAAGPLADVRAGAAGDRVRIDIECVGSCAGRIAGSSVRISGLEIGRAMKSASGPATFSLSPVDGGALLIIDDVADLRVSTEEEGGYSLIRVVGRLNPKEGASLEPAPQRLAEAAPQPEKTPPRPTARPVDASIRDTPVVDAADPGERFRAVAEAHPSPDLSADACRSARARLLSDAWALDALAHTAFCDAADGRIGSALSAFERILQYDPQDVVALYGRAAIAAARGDRDEATRWYDGARAAERLSKQS